MAEKLRSIVGANFTFEGERISVTASIGVSTVLDEIGNENRQWSKKPMKPCMKGKASGA
ncbi:MAG: hypothetical protein R3A45_08690 [Bdellovibrionota bacterium]